jgi:16S rRNA (uracil1498-N3)-methyltransferase
MKRFYHPDTLELQQMTNLSDVAAHHASNVMRLKISDKIILFNNDVYDYVAEIIRINKKNVEVIIQSKIANHKNSALDIKLIQSISSNEKMDWIIQKSVELGVSTIIPVYSERSIIKLKDDRAEKKLSHWKQIIQSACEQCGRSKVPEIFVPKKLDTFWSNENISAKEHLKLILSPLAQHSLNSISMASPSSVDIMIGPEGGFANEEIICAEKNGFIPINLGPRILRTETAPLTMLSLLQYKYGDFV